MSPTRLLFLLSLAALSTGCNALFYDVDDYVDEDDSDTWSHDTNPWDTGPWDTDSDTEAPPDTDTNDNAVMCVDAAPHGATSFFVPGLPDELGDAPDCHWACDPDYGYSDDMNKCLYRAVDVSVLGLTTCVLREDNSVVCWMNENPEGFIFNQAGYPGGRYQKVSAGFTASCGLEIDGEIKCWGRDRKSVV